MSNAPVFHCTFENCSKVFYKKWNYNLHIKMHLKIKQFKCGHCDKSFTQKCNYNKHLRTHMVPTLKDRKTFQCHICFKKYTQSYNLRVSLPSISLPTILYEELWSYESLQLSQTAFICVITRLRSQQLIENRSNIF